MELAGELIEQMLLFIGILEKHCLCFIVFSPVVIYTCCGWCRPRRGDALRIVRGRSTVFPMFGERLGDESIVDRSIVFPDVSSVSSAEGCSWTKRNSEGSVRQDA